MLGWSITGKASAEHGSALRSAPSLCRRQGGRAGEGLALRLHVWPASRLMPLPQGPLRGGGSHVEPSHARLGRSSVKLLPSMARHYALLPPFAAGKGRAGEGLALRLHAQPASRLMPLPQGPLRGGGKPCRAEPCSAEAFPVKLLPSMARHYEVAIRCPCSCSRRCRFRARLLR